MERLLVIIGNVKVNRLHDWRLGVAEAMELQRRLAAMVCRDGEVSDPRFIAGLDISLGKDHEMAIAAAVVLSYPELRLVEMKVVKGSLNFPYIPGLLSFRESPLTLAACEALELTPDLVLVDGHGYAHPRRMGFACHVGLFLDTPTIGCAKSLLCGRYEEPGEGAGSYTGMVDRGEAIGAAVRTRTGVRPVYVSIGHEVSLGTAIHWVLQSCRDYRVSEPLRLAHLAAGGNLKQESVIPPAESDYERSLFG